MNLLKDILNAALLTMLSVVGIAICVATISSAVLLFRAAFGW